MDLKSNAEEKGSQQPSQILLDKQWLVENAHKIQTKWRHRIKEYLHFPKGWKCASLFLLKVMYKYSFWNTQNTDYITLILVSAFHRITSRTSMTLDKLLGDININIPNSFNRNTCYHMTVGKLFAFRIITWKTNCLLRIIISSNLKPY